MSLEEQVMSLEERAERAGREPQGTADFAPGSVRFFEVRAAGDVGTLRALTLWVGTTGTKVRRPGPLLRCLFRPRGVAEAAVLSSFSLPPSMDAPPPFGRSPSFGRRHPKSLGRRPHCSSIHPCTERHPPSTR
jgi:hypothetical protein